MYEDELENILSELKILRETRQEKLKQVLRKCNPNILTEIVHFIGLVQKEGRLK